MKSYILICVTIIALFSLGAIASSPVADSIILKFEDIYIFNRHKLHYSGTISIEYLLIKQSDLVGMEWE